MSIVTTRLDAPWVAGIPVHIAVAVIAMIMAAFGQIVLPILLAAFALIQLLQRSSRLHTHSTWIANPIRFAIPILVIFQVSYWIWFGLLADVRPHSLYDWMLTDIPPNDLGVYLVRYLLLHYLLFLTLDAVYLRLATKFGAAVVRLPGFNIPRVAVFSLIAITIYTASTNDLIPRIILFEYAASITNRFFPTIIGVLSYVCLSKNVSRPSALLASILLGMSLVGGYFATVDTSMRQWLFHQSLIFLSVLLTVIVYERRSDLRKYFYTLLVALSVLFILTTANKFERDTGGSMLPSFAESTGEVIQYGSERVLQRLALFTTDGLVDQNQIAAVVFNDPETSMGRILRAIPFLTVVTGGWGSEAETLSIEKRIFQASRTGGNAFELSSTAIAGTTEAILAFGTIPGILTILLFAAIQGAALAVSYRILGHASWINVISQYMFCAVVGMDINNFLRLPINLVLGAILMRFVLNSRMYSAKR